MVDSPHDKFKLIFYESISYDTIHTYIPDMIRKFGTDFQCNPFQIYPLNVAEIHFSKFAIEFPFSYLSHSIFLHQTLVTTF